MVFQCRLSDGIILHIRHRHHTDLSGSKLLLLALNFRLQPGDFLPVAGDAVFRLGLSILQGCGGGFNAAQPILAVCLKGFHGSLELVCRQCLTAAGAGAAAETLGADTGPFVPGCLNLLLHVSDKLLLIFHELLLSAKPSPKVVQIPGDHNGIDHCVLLAPAIGFVLLFQG